MLISIFVTLVLIVQAQPKELRVLFIGNSYTYVNDVPRTVAGLAGASGNVLHYEQHTEGGWTLEMHWNSDITLKKIRKGGWDVVVLQEYSQRTSYEEKDICVISYPFAKLLSEEIQHNNPNAKIQWYQTWGRPYGDQDRCEDIPQVCTFDGMQDAITETYSAYGCMFKPGKVAPVGEAFREFQKMAGDEFFTLYNTNGVSDHHASPKGSYISACVHFSTLYGEPCTGNSFHAGLTNQDHVHRLQVAADSAISQGSWNFPASSSCHLEICNDE